jgi:serine/threonine-protein kinase
VLWPWLLLVLVLVAGGLIAWWLVSRGGDDNGNRGSASPSGEIAVPDVVGQPQAKAVAAIGQSGLVARIVRKPSGDVPAGSVFDEAPDAGSRVAAKTVVTLSVSARASVTVPSVVGQKAPAATAEVHARGLGVRYSSVLSDKARGTVFGQSPAAGAKVAKGTTVVLRVSRGTGAVPLVVGQTRNAALATLEAAGFKAQAFTVPSAETKGKVVAQSPLGGTRAPGDTKVRIYVSGGRKPSTGPPPPPLSQPPPPPPPAPGNDTPAGVEVPDVTGQTQDDAERALEEAGFDVQTVEQDVTDSSQVGTVLDEKPSAGKRAPTGSTVTIYVGRTA